MSSEAAPHDRSLSNRGPLGWEQAAKPCLMIAGRSPRSGINKRLALKARDNGRANPIHTVRQKPSGNVCETNDILPHR
jgi:hypothetical protein